MKTTRKALLFVLSSLLLATVWIAADTGSLNVIAWAKDLKRDNVPATVTPVSPNVPLAKYTVEQGVKIFNLTAEKVKQEVSKGVYMEAWGYNGSSPGPTIVVKNGDRIKVKVTNKLEEATSIHWHGLIVPEKMDGVPDIQSSPAIQPGESFTYEFTVKQTGTFMYHSHTNTAKQEMMGLNGMFLSLPKNGNTAAGQQVDRDYTILLNQWQLVNPGSPKEMMPNKNDPKGGDIDPGTYEVNPEAMMWNLFTFNGKQFPSTDPLTVKKGDKVLIRLGNLSMQSHPIHLHGQNFTVIAKDGVPIKESAQFAGNTINIAPGETYDVIFTADNPGNWPLHCHLPHHTAGKDGKEGGMLTVVNYEGVALPDILED